MVDIDEVEGAEPQEHPEHDAAQDGARRAYEAPRLVSGNIFERVLLSSEIGPVPLNPFC